MNSIYQQLSERIRDDIPDMEESIQRSLYGWQMSQESPDESMIYIDSVALNLMSLYSGVERVFELIARYIDCKVPYGKSWHKNLLKQMAQDISNLRPAVIKQKTATMLDEFRGFRNVVHNIYSVKLDPKRMVKMMSILPELWQNLREELLAFAEFLEELSEQDNADNLE